MAEGRFHVANFGCRASQSEGAAIHAELVDAELAETAAPEEADVLVVNSCTVTEEADRDVRRLIRRVARRNPGARIVVTGCYAQRRPEELADMPQVRYVVGNSSKSMVGRLALAALEDPVAPGRAEIFCSDIFETRQLRATEHQGSAGRTRATVKVQDGCNANCSFCVIPSVRGRSRSLEPAAVLAEVQSLVEGGYREVVFSGIHLGTYGRDLRPATSLAELLGATLDRVTGLERLRLSSIEPLEVTDEIVGIAATHPRVAHHFHVPLQSGSSRILRQMRRPYTPAAYLELAGRIRSAIPDASIGADVMVGFPGETDEEFMETVELVERSPLTYLHVFPFSSRPGTVAAELPDPVPDHVIRFRGRALRSLIARKNREFRERFLGRDLDFLVLDEVSGGGGRRALSDNFLKVRVSDDLEVNRWHRRRVAALSEDGLQVSSTTTAAETS